MMEEKTRQILAGSSDDRDPLWHRVAEKLAEVGLASYAPVIGRILGREVGAWAVQIVFGMDKGVFI